MFVTVHRLPLKTCIQLCTLPENQQQAYLTMNEKDIKALKWEKNKTIGLGGGLYLNLTVRW